LSLLHKSHLVLKLVTKHRPPLGIKKKKIYNLISDRERCVSTSRWALRIY
jgi:hypothetical protein